MRSTTSIMQRDESFTRRKEGSEMALGVGFGAVFVLFNSAS